MSWLIVPVTVILLRGAFAVLLLAGAESIGGDYLSARVRRALWIICIFLMVMPHFPLPFQYFAIDLTAYHEQMLHAAEVLPREIAHLVGDMKFAKTLRDYSFSMTGLSYQNYPYLLGMILMIVPALFLLLGSYLRCRKRTEKFQLVRDERILGIWEAIHPGARRLPVLLDSGGAPHPPVLFGFFRQKLLLPVAYMQTLTDSEVELLLTHEYIHYRSGDGIINIFTLCLWPFCWYNPFFLAARRRLRINCELACDAEVLKKFPHKTAEYGRLLLAFANTERPPEVAMAFREYAGELRSRIIYMTQLPARRKSSLGAILFLVVLLGAPFCLFSTVTRQKEPFTAVTLRLAAETPAQWHVAFKGTPLRVALSDGREKISFPVTSSLKYWQLRELKGRVYLELSSSGGEKVTLPLPEDLQLKEIIPVKKAALSTGSKLSAPLFTASKKEFILSLQKE